MSTRAECAFCLGMGCPIAVYQSSWCIMLYNSFISLLILCLVVLPIIESRALKFQLLFVNFLFSPSILGVFSSYNRTRCCYVHRCLEVCLPDVLTLNHYKTSSLSLVTFLSQSLFVSYQYTYTTPLVFTQYIFIPSFYFQTIFVF